MTVVHVTTAIRDSGTIFQRQRWSILGLAGPAYLWLIVTVFLPLSAMFYFSFLTKTPLLAGDAQFTLKQYAAFFHRDFYQALTVRSLMLGLYVTAFCILIGYPAALFLARFIEVARVRRSCFWLSSPSGAMPWCGFFPGRWCCGAEGFLTRP